MSGLRLAKLPARTPVRLTILLPPELYQTLEAYAAAYCDAYGETEKLAELVPFMLQAFVDSDKGFQKALRTLSVGTSEDSNPDHGQPTRSSSTSS